jgi:hypothetical protein
MQIAMEIRNFLNSFSEHPNWLKLDQFKITFSVNKKMIDMTQNTSDLDTNPDSITYEGSSAFWEGYLKAKGAKISTEPGEVVFAEGELERLDKLFGGKK